MYAAVNPSMSYVSKSFLLHVKRKIDTSEEYLKKKTGEIARTQ